MSKIDVLCDRSQAELKEVPVGLLEMGHLQMLYLEGNQLQCLPENFFQKLTKLTWLDLRNNKLKSIPVGIAQHAALEYLLLENNEIRALPNELGLVPNLKVLQIACNPLQYPSQEVISQSSENIISFLKHEYHKANASEVPPTEETLSTEEDQCTVTSSTKKEKISIHELLKRSSKSARLRMESFPVITVRSLSAENQNKLKKKNSVVSLPLPTHRPVNKKPCSRQVRKISRYCAKLHDGKPVNERQGRNFEDEVAKQELKEIWLSKLKELLADQEKLLQQERNLKSLSAWRLSKRLEPVRTTNPKKTVSAPYDTDPHYNKILSRKDLALAVDDVIRKGKTVPENVDMQKLISEIACQLKNLEVMKKAQDLKPRSEVLNAETEIQMLIDLHKRVNALQSKNDSC